MFLKSLPSETHQSIASLWAVRKAHSPSAWPVCSAAESVMQTTEHLGLVFSRNKTTHFKQEKNTIKIKLQISIILPTCWPQQFCNLKKKKKRINVTVLCFQLVGCPQVTESFSLKIVQPFFKTFTNPVKFQLACLYDSVYNDQNQNNNWSSHYFCNRTLRLLCYTWLWVIHYSTSSAKWQQWQQVAVMPDDRAEMAVRMKTKTAPAFIPSYSRKLSLLCSASSLTWWRHYIMLHAVQNIMTVCCGAIEWREVSGEEAGW